MFWGDLLKWWFLVGLTAGVMVVFLPNHELDFRVDVIKNDIQLMSLTLLVCAALGLTLLPFVMVGALLLITGHLE